MQVLPRVKKRISCYTKRGAYFTCRDNMHETKSGINRKIICVVKKSRPLTIADEAGFARLEAQDNKRENLSCLHDCNNASFPGAAQMQRATSVLVRSCHNEDWSTTHILPGTGRVRHSGPLARSSFLEPQPPVYRFRDVLSEPPQK